MRATRIRDLLLLAVLAAGFGWSFVRLYDRFVGHYPPVAWLSPAALWLLALGLLLWTLGVRRRLAHAPGTKPLPPLVAARTAALALAASRTGALVAGGYAGSALVFATRLSVPLARDHAINSLLAVAGAVAVTAVALWLERICRLPEDPKVGASATESLD